MFGIPRVRLVIYGCLALGVGLSLLLWPSHPDPYDATLVKAFHEQTVAHRAALAAARQAAVTTRTVYVAKRRTALDAVGALPPAQIVGDTLHIPAGDFVVAHPVALYVAQLQATVATIKPVVQSSDAALLATDAVDSTAKVVDADQTTEVKALKASQPGRLRRAWDRVKVPLAFVAGAYVGSRVVR